MSLINKINGRSLDQVVDILSEAYIKSASLEKSAIDPDVKRALIGAALGAGVGGTGMAARNLVAGKKLSLRDVMKGALLGSVPGAALGYFNPLGVFSKSVGSSPKKEEPPSPSSAASVNPAEPPLDLKNLSEEQRNLLIAEDKALIAKGQTPKNFTIKELSELGAVPKLRTDEAGAIAYARSFEKKRKLDEDIALIAKGQPPKNFTIKDLAYFGAIPPLKLQYENTEAARKLDQEALRWKELPTNRPEGEELKLPPALDPNLGRFAPDVLAPYRQPAPGVPTSTEPMVSFGGEPTRQSTVDKLMRKGKSVDSKGPLYPYGIAPPKK